MTQDRDRVLEERKLKERARKEHERNKRSTASYAKLPYVPIARKGVFENSEENDDGCHVGTTELEAELAELRRKLEAPASENSKIEQQKKHKEVIQNGKLKTRFT